MWQTDEIYLFILMPASVCISDRVCVCICVCTQHCSFLVILIKTDAHIVENVTPSFRENWLTLLLISVPIEKSSFLSNASRCSSCVCVCVVLLSICYEWYNSLLLWHTVLCLPVIQSPWWPIRALGEIRIRPLTEIFHYTVMYEGSYTTQYNTTEGKKQNIFTSREECAWCACLIRSMQLFTKILVYLSLSLSVLFCLYSICL